MRPTCPRQFEAEALRDGRLGGAEVANFERHRLVCSACAREVLALEKLGAALRDVTTSDEAIDELRVRRERTRLLAAFDAALVPSDRPVPRRAYAFGIVALTLLLVAMGGYEAWRSRTPLASRVEGTRASAPAIIGDDSDAIGVQADSSALWSKRVDGERDKIILERGALSIRVDHTRRERRLLVVLPDGELEDIGTKFTVSAEAGRTTQVTVQEGRVVLRIRGETPLALGAGETWSTAPLVSPSVCASCEAVSIGSSGRPATPLPRAIERGSAAVSESTAEFRVAMAALDRGESVAAASRFAEFLRKHPRDPRAEDAAYLRVIALQRGGEVEAMKGAAREYLRRYPNGFRRAEVEGL